MTKYHAGVPMERVHLDFFGPLPESTAGNSEHLGYGGSIHKVGRMYCVTIINS